MTWTQFRAAMLQSFLIFGLKTADLFELGSIKKKVYSRRMILASAYIRMIKEYNPDEVDSSGDSVHVLTADEMFNVMRNLNGIFDTEYFYNFREDY